MMTVIHALHKIAQSTYQQWIAVTTSLNTLRVGAIATIVVALFYVNAAISARDVGLGVHSSLSKDNLAAAIEKIPAKRSQFLNKAFHQGKISGYRQQLELQILEDIKPETSALASRIRKISKEQWRRMWKEQAFQVVTGKLFGGLLASTAGNVNPQDLKNIWNLADNIIQAGYSTRSFKDALAGKQRKLEPNLDEKQRLLAMKIKLILDQSLKAHQHELMAARFRFVILGLKKSYCKDSEETYREKLQKQAQYYAAKWNLTQYAGSKDSIWKDWMDFQAWLHERVLEVVDPDCKKEEKPKGLALGVDDCPRKVSDVDLVFERGKAGQISDPNTPAYVLRCLYYKVFKDTGKQKPGVSHVIGDTMVTLVRLKSREAALGKYPWAMDLARRKVKDAIKNVTATTSEEKPSRDRLIITAKASDALSDGPMYVKLAAFRYRNCIILIHTHRSRDEQWLEDLLSTLRKKFEQLIDEKG